MSERRSGVSARLLMTLLSEAREKPALVYDLRTAELRARTLAHHASERRCTLLMAAKAMPHSRYLELGAKFLDGFDVSNLAEYASLPSGLKKKLFWMTTPALSRLPRASQLARGKNRLIVSLETPEQLERLGQNTSFAVRLDSNTLLGAKNKSRFGASRDLLGRFARDARFTGFHLHHGFQKNRLSDYLNLARKVMRLTRALGVLPAAINLGGGLATLEDDELPLLFERARALVPRPVELCFEPGRALVEKSGYAVGRVVSVNRKRARTVCTTNLSKLCHLTWSNPRFLVLSEGPLERVEYYGPTCSEHDWIGSFKAPAPRIGDPVVLANISGYSAAWNQGFNGISPARVLLLE